MRHRTFGAAGRDVPLVGQGTWAIPERGDASARARRALREGIELGLTHIDTAEMYGDGGAERVVAEAIAGIPRERLFLVSKVLPSNASYAQTIRSCEASLRRLRTEYLDAYLLHWPSAYPLRDTMRAMEALADDGKIRAIGVSNFDVADVERARAALERHPLACNQVLYHLGERGIERRLIPHCAAHGIAVVGYSPFGSGSFPASDSPGGRVLARVAERHGASARAVALAFLVRLDGTFSIPKAASPAHVRDNAAGGDLVLAGDDIAAIDAAFPAPDHDVPLAVI